MEKRAHVEATRELGIQRGFPSGNRLRQTVELTQIQKHTFHICRRICEYM